MLVTTFYVIYILIIKGGNILWLMLEDMSVGILIKQMSEDMSEDFINI